jgi:hypothetical protein
MGNEIRSAMGDARSNTEVVMSEPFPGTRKQGTAGFSVAAVASSAIFIRDPVYRRLETLRAFQLNGFSQRRGGEVRV